MSGWVLVAVIVVPFVAVWIRTIVEVVRRWNRSRRATVLWLVALVLFPLVAVAVRVVVKPPPAPRVADEPAGQRRAEAFVELAEARQRGELDDAAYAERAAVLIAASSPGRG